MLLAVFQASALFADASDGVKATYVTGWGRPRDGLQVGLRYVFDQRIVRPGEAARIELVIRNLTSKEIEIRHFTGTAFRYSVEKTVVTAFEQQIGRAVVGRKITLRSCETFAIKSFLVGHVRRKTDPVLNELSFAVQPLLLSAGTYQVGCESLMLRRDATDVAMTTGYVDIELAKSK